MSHRLYHVLTRYFHVKEGIWKKQSTGQFCDRDETDYELFRIRITLMNWEHQSDGKCNEMVEYINRNFKMLKFVQFLAFSFLYCNLNIFYFGSMYCMTLSIITIKQFQFVIFLLLQLQLTCFMPTIHYRRQLDCSNFTFAEWWFLT